jgi:hypothetical protein
MRKRARLYRVLAVKDNRACPAGAALVQARRMQRRASRETALRALTAA